MSWAELVAEAEVIRAAAAAKEARLGDLRVVGVGWATVEADRAFGELGSILDGAAGWVAVERDALLGASRWRREPSVAAAEGGPALFVLEPDTEGRLAAFLARFGEGVGVVYLSSPGGRADRLVPIDPRWGPFAIVQGRGG